MSMVFRSAHRNCLSLCVTRGAVLPAHPSCLSAITPLISHLCKYRYLHLSYQTSIVLAATRLLCNIRGSGIRPCCLKSFKEMKPGFSKKSNKKKNKQKKKPGKGKGDGDDIMQDAAASASPVHMHESAPKATTPEIMTAKDKQRQRMELKKALKVKVATLKSSRNKLTKLAGNKTERRQLNQQLQGLLQDQLFGNGSKQQDAVASPPPAAAADTMAD